MIRITDIDKTDPQNRAANVLLFIIFKPPPSHSEFRCKDEYSREPTCDQVYIKVASTAVSLSKMMNLP